MKCLKHTTEAIGICVYCGRALCSACIQSPTAPRLVCSAECGAGLDRQAQGIETLAQRSLRSAQASTAYCYLGAALSASGAIVAWFMLPSPFLILFAAGCALVLLLSGIWYGRASKKGGS